MILNFREFIDNYLSKETVGHVGIMINDRPYEERGIRSNSAPRQEIAKEQQKKKKTPEKLFGKDKYK